MNAAADGPLEWLLPIAVLAVALVMGPLPIMVRSYIRGTAGPSYVQLWYRPATLGLGFGMLATVVGFGTLNPNLTLSAALLCFLFLLASIDWQWRWLPIEWTLGVIALGLFFGFQSNDFFRVLVQMAVPALVLLLVRQIVFWALKKEAMGLGDVWLIAGLGAFLAPFDSFLLIGFAAVSGLAEIALRMLVQGKGVAQSGVSYGTHMCIVFVVIRNFASLG